MRILRFFPPLLLSTALMAGGPAFAAPPPRPGGHIPTYFGGDNQAGYPALTPTDAGDANLDGLPARLAVTSRPNPFLGKTTLRFPVRDGRETRVQIFDLAGKLVHELMQPARQPGWREVAWDGRDPRGRLLPAGVYVYRVKAGGQVATGKMVFLH